MSTLAELLAGTSHEVRGGSLRAEISRVTADSRTVDGHSIFVAVRGNAADGHTFVEDALARGAQAIVVEDDRVADAVTTIRVPDTRRALAELSRALHASPDKDLTVFAVTGTNGKTTVAHMIRDLERARGVRCGLLGTIEYDTGVRRVPAPLTTPGPEQLFGLLAEARDAGATSVAMEASSHALDQQRLLGVEVDVACFTNLGRDHLDYHASLDAYLDAKRLLLRQLDQTPRAKIAGTCVVNLDDASLAARDWPTGAVSVGRSEQAVLRRVAQRTMRQGIELEVEHAGRRSLLKAPLLGGYNVDNLLVAAGAAIACGCDVEEIASWTPEMNPVPGRLEAVDLEDGPLALIDYAHTPDGITSVLEAVRPLVSGRVHIVFGCGGNRDRGKRPAMARAALAGADRVILTTDNPRTEDLEQIHADIAPGLAEDPSRARRVDDRAEAIALALSDAGPDDAVVVAGKGHETYQILGDQRLEWDDRVAVREAWRRCGEARA